MAHRLFVAAWPDAETIRLLRSLERADEPGVRWVPESNWHLTLRFVGDADPDEVATALRDARLPSSPVRLGPEVERLGDRLIVVAVDGAADLAAAVHRATHSFGPHDQRPFRGHLTLARTRRGARSSVVGAPIAGEWHIDEIALVASELQPTGSAYVTLATFPTQ